MLRENSYYLRSVCKAEVIFNVLECCKSFNNNYYEKLRQFNTFFQFLNFNLLIYPQNVRLYKLQIWIIVNHSFEIDNLSMTNHARYLRLWVFSILAFSKTLNFTQELNFLFNFLILLHLISLRTFLTEKPFEKSIRSNERQILFLSSFYINDLFVDV